jgi:hypothetical protein
MVKVAQVPYQLVHQSWPTVLPFFERVEPRFRHSYSLEQVRTQIFTNQWCLIIATKDDKVVGAMSVNYVNRMNERVAMIHTIAGNGIVSPEGWGQVKVLFSKNGATAVEGTMRPSMARLCRRVGFAEKYTTFGLSL